MKVCEKCGEEICTRDGENRHASPDCPRAATSGKS